MSSLLSTYTITADDFKDTASIDALIDQEGDKLQGVNKNDSNGYTPLCFASLNSIEPKFLLYLVKNGANTNTVCAKGKTPIQLACMAMNASAVEFLIGLPIEYDYINEYGNLEQLYDSSAHLPLFKDADGKNTIKPTDADGNPNEPIYKKAVSHIYDEDVGGEAASVTDKDILEASKLAKEDILKVLLKKYCGDDTKAFAGIKDKSGNNPLHLAVLASCYGSVDLFLGNSEASIPAYANDAAAMINSKNSDDITPFLIALEAGDAGLLEKFVSVDDSVIAPAVSFAIANERYDIINELYNQYTNKFTSDIIASINTADLDFSQLPSRLWPNAFTIGSEFAQIKGLKFLKSDYIWMYHFTVSSATNTYWGKPNYLCSEELSADTEWVIIDNSYKYTEAIINNGSSSSLLTKLKLSKSSDNQYVFVYINPYSNISTASDSAIIVKVNSSHELFAQYKLPSDTGQALYTIDVENNKITWNENHKLYTLLSGKSCYPVYSEE